MLLLRVFFFHSLRVEAVFISTVTTRQGMRASVDSSTTNLVFPALQGTLSVMLIYTVLEFCLAVLTAVVWWKQARSNFPGVSVLASLPGSCLVYFRFGAVSSMSARVADGPAVVGHEIHIGAGLMGMEDR